MEHRLNYYYHCVIFVPLHYTPLQPVIMFLIQMIHEVDLTQEALYRETLRSSMWPLQ